MASTETLPVPLPWRSRPHKDLASLTILAFLVIRYCLHLPGLYKSELVQFQGICSCSAWNILESCAYEWFFSIPPQRSHLWPHYPAQPVIVSYCFKSLLMLCVYLFIYFQLFIPDFCTRTQALFQKLLHLQVTDQYLLRLWMSSRRLLNTWKSPLLRTILFCMSPSRFHTDFSSLGLESGLRFLGSAPPGKLGLWRQTATFPVKPSLGPAWSPAPHTLSSRGRARRKVNTEGQEGEELVRGVFLVMLKAGLSPHQRMWNLWQ